MNKITVVLITSFVAISAPLQADHIKLNSLILNHSDGRFPIGINGEVVTLIKQYQGQIAMLLQGKRTPNGYEGIFEFEGKKTNIQELRQLEAERGINRQLIAMRHVVIKQFMQISAPFRALVIEFGIKPLMADLIEESMTKRHRSDSLLYVWAKMDSQNDHELFDKYIKSLQDLEVFMIDLNNFLGDIVYNCPRGYAQYKEHFDKFNKTMPLIKEMELTKEHYDLFLKYINKKLFTLPKNDISRDKVKELYNDFKLTINLTA